MNIEYKSIRADQIPAGVRFDTPRRNQGQMVTESYGGFSRYEHDHGDEYMRITDVSTGKVQYFQRDRAAQ